MHRVGQSTRHQSWQSHQSAEQKDEVSSATPGTLQSIGRQHGRWLTIARGADKLTDEILPDVVKREAFHQLRMLQQNQRPLLRGPEMPILNTNLFRNAIVTLSIGAPRPNHVAAHSLTLREFTRASEEGCGNYAAPNDDELERQGKWPVAASAWIDQALRARLALPLFLGREWYAQRAAAQFLLRWHEQDPKGCPLAYMTWIGEELRWRFCQEIIELDRQMLRALNNTNPS